MAQNGVSPKLDKLSLSDAEADDNTEDLFASPSLPSKQTRAPLRPHASGHGNDESSQPQLKGSESEEDAAAAHEASLQRELSSLRKMNAVITGITSSLEKAKSNMDTVSATVNNASTLLTTWTRILSQTEHNQRLILNPNWHGATQDIADGENDEILKRQEKERRLEEEERRKKEKEAEKEAEERRRLTEPAVKSGRGRGRGTTRGTGRAGGSAYVGVGGQGGTRGGTRGSAGTARSGFGRGVIGTRGRG